MRLSHQPDPANLIQEIHEKLPATHLVMHGSSSVPKSLVDELNEHGGEIRPTWGVAVEEIQRGIRHGVRKINVDTDARIAMTGAIRKVLAQRRDEYDPREYLKPARAAMKAVYVERMRQFGQAGHADDYEPKPLSALRDFNLAGRTSLS